MLHWKWAKGADLPKKKTTQKKRKKKHPKNDTVVHSQQKQPRFLTEGRWAAAVGTGTMCFGMAFRSALLETSPALAEILRAQEAAGCHTRTLPQSQHINPAHAP